ncbi:glycosyltransferase family 2 protein, partial [Escherichia coli]|nr:glycosyltransferase family 2 protein [Escherichia coli]
MIQRAVIIVCYHPVKNKLENLVDKVSGPGTIVYIANNGGITAELNYTLNQKKAIVINFDRNLGLGEAINRIAEIIPESVEAIFTFDQDTSPPDDYIIKTWTHFRKLMSEGINLGVLTPKFIDSRSGYLYQQKPKGYYNRYTELLVTLQSGMCIPKNVWKEEKFNSDLFIEFVDTEWCYRIHSKKYKVIQMDDIIMSHEVSELSPKKILSFSLMKYKPIRRYYFFRNAMFLLQQNYVPLYSKIRLLTGMCNRILSV